MLTWVTEFLATFTCAIFSGAAIYVSLVEHPARLSCGTELAITEFIPSYRRATIMQASLAIVGSASAFIAWLTNGNIWWLIGAVLFGIVVPYTIIGIMPTNKRLSSPMLDKCSQEALHLLIKWGRLHMIRSALSTIALIIFFLNYHNIRF